MEWDLQPIRKWLVSPMMFMSLLYQRTCLVRTVGIVFARFTATEIDVFSSIHSTSEIMKASQ